MKIYWKKLGQTQFTLSGAKKRCKSLGVGIPINAMTSSIETNKIAVQRQPFTVVYSQSFLGRVKIASCGHVLIFLKFQEQLFGRTRRLNRIHFRSPVPFSDTLLAAKFESRVRPEEEDERNRQNRCEHTRRRETAIHLLQL